MVSVVHELFVTHFHPSNAYNSKSSVAFNVPFFILSCYYNSQLHLLLYNTIQYKNEHYYSGINPIEFRGHSKTSIINLL